MNSSMKKILFRNIWIGILFTTSAIAVAVADSRPNIVFLMSDDQNLYSMGCYGTPDVQTPNLDRLANEGVVFDHHYDTTASMAI